MLPSAESERLGREKHVLADRRGLAEDVVAGLTLEDRQWQDLFGVEKSVLSQRSVPAGRNPWRSSTMFMPPLADA